jgi:hypothetical protein
MLIFLSLFLLSWFFLFLFLLSINIVRVMDKKTQYTDRLVISITIAIATIVAIVALKFVATIESNPTIETSKCPFLIQLLLITFAIFDYLYPNVSPFFDLTFLSFLTHFSQLKKTLKKKKSQK